MIGEVAVASAVFQLELFDANRNRLFSVTGSIGAGESSELVRTLAAGTEPIKPEERIEGKDGKFTPNPAYKRPPFDYNDPEASQRELMAGIISVPPEPYRSAR